MRQYRLPLPPPGFCLACGLPFVRMQHNQEFCDGACKQAFYRFRKRRRRVVLARRQA